MNVSFQCAVSQYKRCCEARVKISITYCCVSYHKSYLYVLRLEFLGHVQVQHHCMIVQWIKWSWLYIYSEKVCTVIVILVDFPPPIRAPPACKSNLLSKVGRVSENLATVWVSIYWDPYSVKQMWNYLRRFFPSHSHYYSKFNWSMPKLTPATATFWFFYVFVWIMVRTALEDRFQCLTLGVNPSSV